MNVLYFASGALMAIATINQMNNITSAWCLLYLPACVALGIAVVIQYDKDKT